MAISRVRTFHRTRPQPGNHRQLFALVMLEVRPLRYHVGGDFHLGVQMADTLERLFPHPVAVAAYILGQTTGTSPVFHHIRLLFTFRQRADRLRSEERRVGKACSSRGAPGPSETVTT